MTTTATTSPGRNNLPIIVAVMSCLLATSIGLGISGPLLNLLMNEAGISRTMIGLNTTMFAVAIVVTMPFVPRLVDRLGPGAFLVGCLLISCSALLALKLFPPGWTWFPLRFIFGAGLAGLWAASEVWINQLAEERRRGFLIGIYATMHTGGFAVGAASLKFVGTDGWLPFISGAVLMALAALPIIAILGRSSGLPGQEAESQTDLRIFWFLRAAPFIMGGALVFGTVDIGVFSLLPVYGARLDWTPADASLLLVSLSLANVATQVPVGMLADRMNRRLLLTLLTLIGLVTAIVMPFASGSVLALHSTVVIMGGALFGLYTVSLILLGQRFKGAALTTANAAFVFIYGVGSLIGPAVGGVAMDLWDPHGLAVALIVFLVAYLVGAAALSRSAKPLDKGQDGGRTEISG